MKKVQHGKSTNRKYYNIKKINTPKSTVSKWCSMKKVQHAQTDNGSFADGPLYMVSLDPNKAH